jgi:GH25 family lysozyme M1 (1,4-beta-N-acetylmuramidase)
MGYGADMTDRPTDNVDAGMTLLPGVDVSSAQGDPSIWRGEAGSIKWAGVKMTEFGPQNARYVNPDAAADWSYLAHQNLMRIGYLFGHPSSSPTETVDFFIGEITGLGLTDADGVMLDLETTDGLQPNQVNSWAAHVMAGLHQRLNRTPILYTYLDFAYAGNTASLGNYPLWISDPSSPPGHPRVPPPWKTWVIHQYVASGIIDRDLAKFATVADMEQAFGAEQKPAVGDLDGSVVSGVTAVRWANGCLIIAGIDGLKHVAVRRFDPAGGWKQWWNPSPDPAAGPPGLVSWGAGAGQLFYATQAGPVIELATENYGETWLLPSGDAAVEPQ